MIKMRDWNHAIATLEGLGDWHICCGQMRGRRAFECWLMLGDKSYVGAKEFRGTGYTAMQAVTNMLEKLTADSCKQVRGSTFRVVG